jgi:hypothetical protein
MVDTEGEYWVFGYKRDADDKASDLESEGVECEVVQLVPITEVDALRAEVKDLKARLKAAHDCWFGTFPAQGEDWDEALKRVTDLRVKNWRKP